MLKRIKVGLSLIILLGILALSMPTQAATYYQRTDAYSRKNGQIDADLYTQAQLNQLTMITHGSEYHGNTSLDAVATNHVYQLSGVNLKNFMGSDGVLQLYNESTFMTTAMVQAAANYGSTGGGKNC